MKYPRLDATLLGRPAQHAARVIARGYLQCVLEEAARIDVRISPGVSEGVAPGTADDDAEAIHDFRVALRRFRSWLRAWRPELRDTVHRRTERRIRRVAQLAGRVRDFDVQQAWLAEAVALGPQPVREGAQVAAERLAVQRAAARRDLSNGLLNDLGPATARLSHELRRYYLEVDVEASGAPPVMAVAISRLLEAGIAQLPSVLGRVERASQVHAAHAARIAVKRLRYLFESLDHAPRKALELLEVTQEYFGELHDAQVLLAHLPALTAREPGRGHPAGPRGSLPRSMRAALRGHIERRLEGAFRLAWKQSQPRAYRRALDALSATARRISRAG